MYSVAWAWLLLAFAPSVATANPITSEGAASDARRVTERDVIGSVNRADGLTEVQAISGATDLLRGSERGRGDGYSIAQSNRPGDPGGGFGTQTMLDPLRGFVNVAPAGGAVGQGRQARSRNARPEDPLDLVDLGPEAREWIQDSFKTMVDSVLQLEVNDRGRVSFSVLGVGDFGVAVSADRSQIAFTTGDNVLLTAQRSSDPAVALASSPGAAGGGWQPGTAAAGSGPAAPAQSPVKKALELALEITTHPLSMLVYLILTAYVVLWSILKRQPRRRARHRHTAVLAHSTVTASGRSRRRHRRSRRRRHA